MAIFGHKDNLFQCMSRLIAAEVDPVSQHDDIWERYGETVAVLVMDSSGFSRTCESHGVIHFLSRLMLLRELCQPLLEKHHCKHLNFEADNTFAVFPTASDAVAAALAIQRAVHRSGLMLTDRERYKVSLGVGFGRMLFSETLEGYFGEEMNYASKLGEDIGRGDETLITRATYEAADDALLAAFEPATIETSGVSLDYYRHRFEPSSRVFS